MYVWESYMDWCKVAVNNLKKQNNKIHNYYVIVKLFQKSD